MRSKAELETLADTTRLPKMKEMIESKEQE